jgi:hypothetical protein
MRRTLSSLALVVLGLMACGCGNTGRSVSAAEAQRALAPLHLVKEKVGSQDASLGMTLILGKRSRQDTYVFVFRTPGEAAAGFDLLRKQLGQSIAWLDLGRYHNVVVLVGKPRTVEPYFNLLRSA